MKEKQNLPKSHHVLRFPEMVNQGIEMQNISNLVCEKARDFHAKTVLSDNSISDNFSLQDYVKNKYCVLFFYPLDFTFVCPTEIIAFSNRVEQFRELNTEIIGVSVDSHFAHFAWRNTPREKGGIGSINFPLVSDVSKSISQDYGVLLDNSVALRATFVIDKNFIIRHQSVNDIPLGRNVDEIVRTVKALQHTEKYGEVCPAGWDKGDSGMKPTQEGIAKLLAEKADSL